MPVDQCCPFERIEQLIEELQKLIHIVSLDKDFAASKKNELVERLSEVITL